MPDLDPESLARRAGVEASAWDHTLDTTEGINTNTPLRVITRCKQNPFGKPGVDYSKSAPWTKEPLYDASAVAAMLAQCRREVLEEAEQDAKRYRWLRNRDNGRAVEYLQEYDEPAVLDAAIDAAMIIP